MIAPGKFQPGDDVLTENMAVWHRVLLVEPSISETTIERISYVLAPLSKRGVPARAVTVRVEDRALVANLVEHRPRRQTLLDEVPS